MSVPKKNDGLINPIYLFTTYLELIYSNDVLWDKFQLYVRQSSPHRSDEFFEFQRDPKCIEIWEQMLDNMGGGWPLTFFAAVAFLILAYKEAGHDLDAELAALHEKGGKKQ